MIGHKLTDIEHMTLTTVDAAGALETYDEGTAELEEDAEGHPNAQGSIYFRDVDYNEYCVHGTPDEIRRLINQLPSKPYGWQAFQNKE
jgi:hypothetical protein